MALVATLGAPAALRAQPSALSASGALAATLTAESVDRRLNPEIGGLAGAEAALAMDPASRDLLLDASAEAAAVALMTEEEEDRRELASRSQRYAEEALTLDADDLEARYLRSAAVGIRLETEGATTKIRLAREMWDEVRAILALDPSHPGAHHLQGRLHAGVMRLGAVTRFLARQLVGGDAIDEASWEGAERHLQTAVELSPRDLLYHFDLAIVYLDTDRPELAVTALEAVLAADPETPLDRYQAERARRFLAEVR